MAINPKLLLYIEPKNLPSKLPVIDEITCTMAHALKEAKTGTANYNDLDGDVSFREGSGYRGFHVCSCGAISSNVDYQLENGEVTNSLAVHYLAYHRDEITEVQLHRVDCCDEDATFPTVEQLCVPKSSEQIDQDWIFNAITRMNQEPKPEPSPYGDKTWAVGWRGRGLGHGDFGVIDEDGQLVASLPLNENDREHAHLIVKACNHHHELISMVEETLDMLDSDYISNVVEKIGGMKRRLKEIKNKET